MGRAFADAVSLQSLQHAVHAPQWVLTSISVAVTGGLFVSCIQLSTLHLSPHPRIARGCDGDQLFPIACVRRDGVLPLLRQSRHDRPDQ